MNIKRLISMTLLSTLIVIGCQENTSTAATANTTAEKQPLENNIPVHNSNTFSGNLIETFNTGGYTYVQISTDAGPVWAAGPVTTINKDDHISFSGKIAMRDFYSKSLDRKFESIYFVDAFTVNGVKTTTTAADPHKSAYKPQVAAALKSFNKAENGQTIADLLKNKNTLTGKTVKVRGQVSKYTAGVMGKNWIHIRDSSSQQDLTITTDASAKMDDIILVEGQLAQSKDFGYGYIYDVIIEDAKVKVE